MQDQDKTKDQLIDELNEIRRKVAEFETVQKSRNENESLHREIIGSSSEAIFIIQDGWINYANEKTSEITGYSKEEVLTSSAIVTFVHPDDREMVAQYHASRLQGDETHYRYAFRIVRKDGNVRWVEMNSSLIMWKGKPAALCLTTDITERKRAEEALAESQQKFRSMFENSLDGILLTAPHGSIFDANESACRMLGRTREEICELGREGVVDTTDPRLAISLEQRRRKGRWRGNLNFRRGDGTIFPVEISSNIYKDARGDDRTVMVIRDITDLESAIEAQRKSEEKYRLIFEKSPLGIIHFDANGLITDCNQGFLEIIGSSREQTIGFNLLTSLRNEEVRKAAESALSGKAGRFEGEYTSVTGGKHAWIKLLYAPIHNTEGLITGGLGIIEDVTERKIAEDALRSSEERFKKVFDQGPIGMAILSLDYRWVAVNDKLCEITGYTSDELMKLTFVDITHPEDVQKDVAQTEALVSGDISCYQMDKRYIKKNKEIVWVKLWGSIVANCQGEPSYFLTMIEDITSNKKSEQEKENLRNQLVQSQKMESLGTLVGGIAHDFNNMLQIILGYSQLLLEDQKKDDLAYRDLQSIIDTVKGGADLVNKLLAFGQQASIFPVPLDLNHQVRELVPLISRTLPQVTEIDLDLIHGPATIYADPEQINQVIMNLAINASEAMPNGGCLKIATKTALLDDEYCKHHQGAKPGEYVMLSLSDTGCGMDEKTLSRIFDPFFSTKQRGATRGTGLGLSVTQGIVEQQGGHITCQSEPGKGSEFRIYFPVIEAAPTTKGKTSPSVHSTGTETILVVEDMLELSKLARRMLEKAGYSVITANNGREALQIFNARNK